jgi:hypothetical protein
MPSAREEAISRINQYNEKALTVSADAGLVAGAILLAALVIAEALSERQRWWNK